MNARRLKSLRQAAYRAGPLAPWRSVSHLVGIARARKNRMIVRGEPLPAPVMEIGRIESIRFILSPVLEGIGGA